VPGQLESPAFMEPPKKTFSLASTPCKLLRFGVKNERIGSREDEVERASERESYRVLSKLEKWRMNAEL